MSFVELSEADQWLYSTFTGDSTLMGYLTAPGVFDTFAPTLTTGLYLIYQVQAPGQDLRAAGRMGDGRVFTEPLYLCRIIAPTTSEASLSPAALRMDQLLDGMDITTVNGNHISWQREGPYKSVTPEGVSQRWRELGGFYRAYISGQ